MKTEERLERLESRLAHLEDEVQSLNLALFRKQQELSRLQQSHAQLLQWMKQWRETAPVAFHGRPEDEIPPHY